MQTHRAVACLIDKKRQLQMDKDELRLKVLKTIDANPHYSQRELSRALGVSLGGINYCMKALVEMGMVKVSDFVRSDNKAGYLYLITPAGVAEKTTITSRFLKRKLAEYEALKTEIAELKREISNP